MKIISFLKDFIRAGKQIQDLESRLDELQVRTRDIQDRVHDMLPRVADTQIRAHDAQDRAYDILWQQKTSNHQREMLFWEIYKREGETLEETKLRFFRELPKASGNARKNQLVLSALLKEICTLCEENGINYWLDFGTLIGAVRHEGFIPWDDDIDLGMMRKDAEKLEAVLKALPGERYLFRKSFINHKDEGIIQIFQIRYPDTKWGKAISCIDVFIYDYCNNYNENIFTEFMGIKQRLYECSRQFPVTVGPYKDDKNRDSDLQGKYKTFQEENNSLLDVSVDDGEYIVFGLDNMRYVYHKDKHIFKKHMIFPLKKLTFEGYGYNVPNQYMKYVMPMYGDIFSLPSDMLSHEHVKLSGEDEKILDKMVEKYCEKHMDSECLNQNGGTIKIQEDK